MRKILNPKLLSITIIITTIISFILQLLLNIHATPLYLRNIQIFVNIGSFILKGNLYIVIYFLLVLYKKEKNMKTLNLILFINAIISFIAQTAGVIIRISQAYSYMSIFQTCFSILENILFNILEITMIYGIMKKRKMPYKIFAGILITLMLISFVPFVISTYQSINFSEHISYNSIIFNIINITNGMINSSAFVLFLYLYGKSINERSLKNE